MKKIPGTSYRKMLNPIYQNYYTKSSTYNYLLINFDILGLTNGFSMFK